MQTGKEKTDNFIGSVEIPEKLKQRLYPAVQYSSVRFNHQFANDPLTSHPYRQ